MATYTRTSVSNLLWNNTTTAWTPTGGYPGTSTTADKALFNNTITSGSSTTAVTATVGQIEIANPAAITIAASASQVITIDPTASYGGIGILFSSATGGGLTVGAALALGSDQTWDFGTSGKTLAFGGTGGVSGAFNLTMTGVGKLTAASTTLMTFGGAGKTVTLQNGMVVAAPGVVTILGSASNDVYVGPDAYLDLYTRTLAQPIYTVTGIGTLSVTGEPTGSRFYGAVLLGSVSDTKTVSFTGTNAAISLYSPSMAANLTGSTTDYIEFNATTSTGIAGLTNIANDFYAPGGLRISSLNHTTGASVNRAFNVGATDAVVGPNEAAVFGDSRNIVRVMPSGKLYAAPASVTRTVARNITFDGDAANTHMQNAGTGTTGILAFAGDLTFSGNATNGAEASGTSTNGGIAFTGRLSGPGALRLVTAGSTFTFDSTQANAFSNWTGEFQTPSNVNTVYKNGYATLTNKRTNVNFGSYTVGMFLVNGLDSDIVLAHSSYAVDGDFVVSALFPGRSIDFGPNPITGSVSTNYYVRSEAPANTTAVFAGNISGQLGFGLAGATSATGTLIVSGSNTRLGSGADCSWAGTNKLCLNSARAFGNGSTTADNIVITATGILDCTAATDITLENGAVKQLNSNFSWAGTKSLNLGTGTTTWNAARTITFTGTGTGTLTIPAMATTSTNAWNIGGGATGAKQRLALNGSNASNATTGSVTAGYFRINNANGLGAVGITTTWTVSSGASLELSNGITTPGSKNGSFLGNGPTGTSAGALRSTTSGTNRWQGYIRCPSGSPAAGFRIKADDGTTLTLDPTGSPAYTGIDGPTASTCPLYLDAGIDATLNEDRILAATIGAVYCGNNGASSGRVVLSKANNHVGLVTCESGTTALTHQNAIGPAATGAGVTVNAGATLAVEVPTTYKAVFPGTTTLGSSTTPARFRIGA